MRVSDCHAILSNQFADQMPGGDCKDFSKYHDKIDSNGDTVAIGAIKMALR